jgi:hypothetical protein
MNRYLITFDVVGVRGTFHTDFKNPVIETQPIYDAVHDFCKLKGIEIDKDKIIILLFQRLN